MFYTVGQTNVAITGAGTIDGNAEAFHHRVDGQWQRISDTNITGRCVFFVGCRDVRFDDVLIYHPSGWSTWFLDCDRVQCRGVRSGRGVPAPAKGEIVPFSVENMRFSNMTINSFHAPLYVSIGRSEDVAFLRDITFANCRYRAWYDTVH